MTARIRGAIVLVYASITMVMAFVLGLPEMLLLGRGELCIWIARYLWSPSILWLAGIKVEARLADLPPGPLIFASNHESALDICVLFTCLPRSVRFVAKRELFDLPVFGSYMRLGGHVMVDRANRAQAVESLRAAGAKVRAGTSLIVFAEGTRSRDGRVHPFKKGPFALAMEARVPVVPVTVCGAAQLNPKAAIVAVPGVVRVEVGEAVLPREFPDRNALLVEVRRRIIQAHLALGGLGGDLERPIAAVGREGVAEA
jgi:1-acyl-sn-glycerol-3-phosphate acyltransferase